LQIKGGSGSELATAVARDFGSFQNIGEPQQDGGVVFGSGWAMLPADPQGKLTLLSRRNQDSPLMNGKRFSPATTPESTPIISL